MTHLSIEEAMKEKWRLGQIKYGKKFVGHPLEELDDELIDAMNYCNVALQWGYDPDILVDIQYELYIICNRIRELK